MRWIKLLLPLLLLILAPGCWDYKEISDVFIVTGIAVDKGTKQPVKITVECAVPSEFNKMTSGKVAPSVVFSLEGNTLGELARKMNVGLGRQLVYSHMNLLAIGEELARGGLKEFFDFFERSRETREDFRIILVRDGPAEDALRITNPTEKFSSGKIQKQLQNFTQEWGGDPNVRLRDIVNVTYSNRREPVLTAVKVIGDSRQAGGSDHEKKALADARVIGTGMAVLKDMKLAGFMNLEDTRSYLWITGKMRNTSVSAPCDEGHNMTVRITESHPKVEASLQEETPVFDIKIYTEGYMEASECKEDISLPETVAQYEASLNETLKASMEKTVHTAQKQYQADIFGLGEELYRREPAYMKKVGKDWSSRFKEATVTVTVNLHIRRFGLKSKSMELEE
jgi:spore germination protein KC